MSQIENVANAVSIARQFIMPNRTEVSHPKWPWQHCSLDSHSGSHRRYHQTCRGEDSRYWAISEPRTDSFSSSWSTSLCDCTTNSVTVAWLRRRQIRCHVQRTPYWNCSAEIDHSGLYYSIVAGLAQYVKQRWIRQVLQSPARCYECHTNKAAQLHAETSHSHSPPPHCL